MFKILFLMLFALTSQFCNANSYEGLKQPIREDSVSQERFNFFPTVVGILEDEFTKENQFGKYILFSHADPQLNGLPNFIIKKTDGQEFNAGYFQQLSLGELRKRATTKACKEWTQSNPIKFTIMYAKENRDSVDIGTLQSDPKNKDAVFQVASNFDALESTKASKSPKLVEYIEDTTQGPFASISATPGLILRQYYCFLHDSSRSSEDWQQKPQTQEEIHSPKHINLLEDLNIATQNGYIVASQENILENIIDEKSDRFKIGFHSNIQVTSGLVKWEELCPGFNIATSHYYFYDPTQLINQVFAAAINMNDHPEAMEQAQLILKWTYEATLKSAFCMGKTRVFLTRMGGGVFQNAPQWIDEAIIAAIKDPVLANSGLEVILNNFTLPPSEALKAKLNPRIILDGEVVF